MFVAFKFITFLTVFLLFSVSTTLSAEHNEDAISRPTGGLRKTLTGNGFKRLGSSQYYERGKFVIEIGENDEPTYFVAYRGFLRDQDLAKIKTIERKVAGEDQALIFTSNEVFWKDNVGGGGTTSGLNFHPDYIAPSGSLEEQLIKAGFVNNETAPNLYRGNFKGKPLIFIVEEGKIRQILSEANGFPNSKAFGGEKPRLIPGYREIKWLGETHSVINLATPYFKFSATSMLDGGSKDYDSIEFFKDLNEIELSSLEITPYVPQRSEQEPNFVIGGVNSSKSIRNLRSIAGQSIRQLEARMRPGRDSGAGFLGEDESLLEVMAEDNAYVVDKLRMTHQDIAHPLHVIRRIAEMGLYRAKNIEFNGQPLQILAQFTKGTQQSPFDDGTKHGANVQITNLKTGKKLLVGLLVPYMIERYGFYEGKGTPYRVEPKDVIDVFGLKAK